jgi:division protein CdvB (Snf7/Vps24/ESCRT-III family)
MESYNNWLTGTEEVLASAQLQELDLHILQRRVAEQKKLASNKEVSLQLLKVRAQKARLQVQKARLQVQKAQAKEARVARQASHQAQK